MGIVVIGAVFVDIKGYPLSTYIPGGRNAGRVEQVHGGVSRNVAEDIANVELRPTFVSLVDDTGIGQDVINKLKAHKVNTKYIRTVPDGMGTWLAVFDNDGDVCAAISKRPDTSPSPACWKKRAMRSSRTVTALHWSWISKKIPSSRCSALPKSTIKKFLRQSPT